LDDGLANKLERIRTGKKDSPTPQWSPRIALLIIYRGKGTDIAERETAQRATENLKFFEDISHKKETMGLAHSVNCCQLPRKNRKSSGDGRGWTLRGGVERGSETSAAPK